MRGLAGRTRHGDRADGSGTRGGGSGESRGAAFAALAPVPADGEQPGRVATALGCAPSSIYNWAAAWRRDGIAGLYEADHAGAPRVLDADGEALLAELLGTDPQARGHHATGWTVPLLQTELAVHGYAPSESTLRRALHRLGYCWKRPRFVLGRPDPAYAEKRGS
jgi:transposase